MQRTVTSLKDWILPGRVSELRSFRLSVLLLTYIAPFYYYFEYLQCFTVEIPLSGTLLNIQTLLGGWMINSSRGSALLYFMNSV